MGTSSSTTDPCLSCQNASLHVQTVQDHARKLPTRINRSAMSHEQLKQKLERVEKSLRKETLQVCGSVLTTSRASLKFLSQRLNTSKALRHLHVHRDTWRALLQLIGTHNIPALHRIFKNAKTQKAISSCLQAYNFKICAASKISDKKPSTNVPIQCRLCGEVHWKYNIRRHLQERHPSWETNMSATEFKTFSDNILISSDEETRLGISENLHGCSIVMSEVYDNRRMNALPTVRDIRGDSPRRTRQSVPIYTVPPPFTLLYQTAPLPLITSHFNDVFC
jgi:hypothetical protein